MPLRKLKYSTKIQTLFVPLFMLMALGLLIVYNVAATSLRDEHQERLTRMAHLTDNRLKATGTEMMKLANLFETDRTLKRYLNISSVLGGDQEPLKALLKPLTTSLGIDDLDLYDTRGRRVLSLDGIATDDRRADNITGISGVLPTKAMYGFAGTSNTLKIVAMSPLRASNDTVGYITVSKYINEAYLKELKEISGNELFLVDTRNKFSAESAAASPYSPRKGTLSAGGVTYSVLERPLTGINGEPLGMIVVALSDEDLNASTAKLRLYMFGMLGFAGLFSFIMARLFIKTLVEPLNKITLFTGKVSRGELDDELMVAGKDELTDLARHFNDMRKQLKAERDVVVQYTGNLERAVEERTSELNKVQRQLLQSQKMEAIGQLAGGIAHDFNNFLTAIMGYAGMYQKKLRKDDPLRVYADQIVVTSKQAANMTRNLLTFSKRQAIDPAAVDLNEIVFTAGKTLLRLIGEDIEFKTALHDGPLIVMADSGQMEQVLLNLATNARDAMPDGGCLIIETRTVLLDEAFARRNPWSKRGAYALMTVTDTGTGMDAATKEKIFEPFFTTKDAGKGTGLGLAMVYGIIQQHEGLIDVYSETGAGTVVRIYLPLVHREPGDPGRPKELVVTAAGGTETVLLAEDNELVRELARSGLEEAGYSVIVATDGEEAVEQFMNAKDGIKLLILDVVMPKKNAKAVLDEVRRIKPDVKILFTSGYAEDYLIARGMIESGISLIQKPMSTNDLLQKVRMVLNY